VVDIGYNDNVNVLERTLHIQTASSIHNGKARCEVFESGKLITIYEVGLESCLNSDKFNMEKQLKHVVSKLHQDTIESVEQLFHIVEKVNKSKHMPSNIKLGNVLLNNNFVEDSKAQFQRALAIDPFSISALNGLAECYIRTNNNQKVIELLSKALEMGNEYADVLHNLGLAYLNEKQHSDAQLYLQKSLRVNPAYGKSHYSLALAYLESIIDKENDESFPPSSIRLERAFQQLNLLEPLKLKGWEVLMERLKAAVNTKKMGEAVKLLRDNQREIFKTNTYGLIGMNFYLKFMYGGKSLSANVIRDFKKELYDSLDKHPDYADLWNSLGIVHLIQCMNLFLQASVEFEKALEINPSFEKALKNKKLTKNDGKEFLILLKAILK
jgi:tetratricopeptide (TPR) repeat protein